MSTIWSAPAAAQDGAGPSLTRAAAALKRWWRACARRRIERAMLAQLWSMSDHELKDIGLTRSGIHGALRESARGRHSRAREAVS